MLHRPFVCILLATGLLALPATPPIAADPGSRSESSQKESETTGRALEPNPYLSFLPADARPDYRYWRKVAKERSALRRANLATIQPKGITSESEPNDTRLTANPLPDFGSGAGEITSVDVTGQFTSGAAPTVIGPFAEDEGAIGLASPTGLTLGSAVLATGTIGDGAFGSAGTGSGDFDFFAIPGVKLGQLILIDVDTASPFEALDPFIALYDSAGNIVALNEDQDATLTFDSFLAVPAPADDDYFLSVGGSLFPFAALLRNPFDPSSGTGAGSEGDYQVTIQVEEGDQDWFSFDLEACDILGISLLNGQNLTLIDPTGQVVGASSQDLSGLAYPSASPLPGGANAVFAHVATVPGTYAIRVLGEGGLSYTLSLRLFRPAESISTRLFVDFDGATIDPVIFGGTPGDTTLSPLSSFLGNWGLAPADESAVIDAILANLEENLKTDPTLFGPNGNFAIEILNSRDHADPFGQPGVSRLIVGGTIPELGLPTIGIAESIDVGNFEGAETGVILLDLLSGSAADPNSLNSFPLAPGASMIDLVGQAVGNIAAHEAGHYLGNFHTEQFNAQPNLMDQGGNLPNTIGLGPDGIFGNGDDVDVDFGEDLYVGPEGFAGFENTLTTVSCGYTDLTILTDDFELGNLSRWTTSVP